MNDTHVVNNPLEDTQQANTSEKKDHRRITRDPVAEIQYTAQSAQEQLEKQVKEKVSQAIDQATDKTQEEVAANMEEARRIIKTEEARKYQKPTEAYAQTEG